MNARRPEKTWKENCRITQKTRLFPGRLCPRVRISQKLYGGFGTGREKRRGAAPRQGGAGLFAVGSRGFHRGGASGKGGWAELSDGIRTQPFVAPTVAQLKERHFLRLLILEAQELARQGLRAWQRAKGPRQ